MKEDEEMYSCCHDKENLNVIVDDGVRHFCLCEKVNEEYMRSLMRQARGARGIVKTERLHFVSLGMLLYSVLMACGYYLRLNDTAMTMMFGILFVMTVVITICNLAIR